LEDQGVDERVILQWVFKKWVGFSGRNFWRGVRHVILRAVFKVSAAWSVTLREHHRLKFLENWLMWKMLWAEEGGIKEL
jgi:hypothetical protein